MLVSSSRTSNRAVSIILPTFNRGTFLPDAFGSIRSQTFTDWELIVVDDGSTDDTRDVVAALARGLSQPVRYVSQENQGAYGARNTGLNHALGDYIAFYDSDDLWLPHHLKDSVEGLDANPEVDWVYGACRIINMTSGAELAPSSFYENGVPRPFLGLHTRTSGRLRIIEDSDAARCQILHGLYCGLQNSVIRRRLFENYRFNADLRNEAEDQVIVIWALATGFHFAYLNDVHVDYRIHESNSSTAALSQSFDKQRRVAEALIAGFERMRDSVRLSLLERRALARRLADEYFWHLGYATLWMNGDRRTALRMLRKGIACWPWNWRYYKTYAASMIKSIAGLAELH